MPRTLVTALCAHCGKTFERPAYRIKEGQRHCSPKCHYRAAAQTPEEIFNRFVRKATDQDACWGWTAAVNQRGYGHITYVVDGILKRDTAHRFSYKLHKGPIPGGMFVCHTCDNTSCSNPNHLFLGTPADNAADMKAKGRQAAKLSVEQVIAIRASSSPGRALARAYGVSKTQIRQIKRGLQWRHIL
jgi:hypothetical protein